MSLPYRLVLGLALFGPVLAAFSQPASLDRTLALARELVDRGEVSRALSALEKVGELAPADDRGAARACLEVAWLRARVGAVQPALSAARQAVCRASQTHDPGFVRSVALGAEVVARQLGDTSRALEYLELAREAGRSIAWGPVYPDRLESGDVGGGPRTPLNGPGLPGQGFVDVAPLDHNWRPEKPAGDPVTRYTHRPAIEAFNRRLRQDETYLAEAPRLKSFRKPHHDPDPPVLACPVIPPPEIWTIAHDFKLLGEAWKYWKFVIELGRTLDDTFSLAVLYVNYSFLRNARFPLKDELYYATKGAAAITAMRKLIAFSVTSGSMDLMILSLGKTIIDIVRKHEKRHPNTAPDPE